MCAQRYQMPDPTVVLTDEIILQQIQPGSRVIDLGCGDGRLLEKLRAEHQCSILGIELDINRVLGAVARGEWPAPCHIRESDELQELCGLMNAALENARAQGEAAARRAAPGEKRAAG